MTTADYEKAPDPESRIPSDWRPGKDRCKLHGQVLVKDRIEIAYGLIGFRQGHDEAKKRLFPNANSDALGDCVVMTDPATGDVSPKYAEVLYCPKCRLAEKRWNYRNRQKPFTT